MAKEEARNSLFYLFGKTWHYSEGNRLRVVAYWIMFMISEVFNSVMGPLVWAKMIEVLTVEGITANSIQTLKFCLLLLMLRMAISWSFHGPARCLERVNAFKARTNYWRHLLKGVIMLPLEWHTEHHTGDSIDKVNKGTSALFDFSEEAFVPIKNSLQLLISFAALAYFSWLSGIVVVVLVSISAWITMRFDRVLIAQYKEINQLENQISEGVIDAITNISTIIVLRVEKLVFEALMHKVEKPLDLFRRNQNLSEIKWFLTSVCANLMITLSTLIYFYQNYGAAPGTLVAGFFLLTQYLDRISDMFYQFAAMYGGMVRQKSKVMNAEDLGKDFRKESFANHVLPTDWQKLEVRNLSFSYHRTIGDLHLRNISFEINRGETIALVGRTGGGKSTLLKIMRDLYHPESIELWADGEKVPTGFEGISRDIALVQQDPEILSRTIFENITMGAEHDLEFVRKFTDMACFTEVAESLPKQFESSIKEKGVNLSGGQQQRLALSRGLLACHDKSIVLLDEPASSLDMITTISVYGNIFREFKGKTVISTIHQLHLLPLFDRIMMVEEGVIVATGTLPELLATSRDFTYLWETMQRTTVMERVLE